MKTANQLKSARYALGLTREQLAAAAGVSSETIKRLEGQTGDLRGNVTTLSAIQKTLEGVGVQFLAPDDTASGPGLAFSQEIETSGVEFVPSDNGGPGVRLKRPTGSE